MVLNFPSSPAAGALHNASNGLAYAFDGVKWTSQGSFNTGTVNVLKLDSIASSFNGSLKTFNLKVNNITVKPVNDQAVLISVNNVVLEPTVAYSINVNTGQITFTTAPTGGHAFFGILYSRIPVIDSITNPIQLSNGDKGDITVTNAGAVNEAFTIDAGVISTDKIADDAVTADKLANSINSAIAANTAKISNATHTGDVTGSTSLSIANDAVITSKIADDAVTSAKIAPNAITSSHIAADTVIAADIAANAITASELADNAVDTAAIVDNAVTGAKIADNLDIPDSNKIRFGTGNDLEIFHSGSNAFITNTTGFTSLKSSNGILYLSGNNTHIRSGDDGETQAVFNDNGSVDLYYDNSKKLETVTGGANVTGALGVNTTSPASTIDARAASGATITARNTGTAASIAMSVGSSTNQLVSRGINSSTARDLLFMQGNTTAVKIDTSNNFLITNDNAKLQIGAGQDLELYHDGTNSNIVNSTGNLHINADAFLLKNAANSESYIRAYNNLQVELYYDNSLKLQTTSTGIDVNGSVTADDIITAGALLHEGDTDTLVHFSAADTIDLKTSGTERLRINNSGVSLFGVLFTNGRNISLGDSGSATDDRITFGESQDLQIYHDGNNKIEAVNGYVRIAATTSSLYLDGNNIHIRSGDGGETQAKFFDNGAVELFYDNSKKLETTSTGIKISSGGQGLDEMLRLDAGGNSNGHGTKLGFARAGDLRAEIQAVKVETSHNETDIVFKTTKTGSLFEALRIVGDTKNIQIPNDTGKLQLGASQSLNIFYDGNSHIDNNNGSLKINTASGTVQINKGTTEHMAVFNVDGESSLYFDNSRKLQTTSAGITVTDVISITDSAGAQRLLMGNQDSAGANCPKILNSGNGILTIGIGDSWSGDGGTLTDQLKVLKDGNIQIPNDNAVLQLGASQDLEIVHTGSQSTIQSNGVDNLTLRQQYAGGYLFIHGDNVHLRSQSTNELYFAGNNNNDVKLYFDNSVKFQTTSTGNLFLGSIKGADNADLILGNSDDFQLVHTGTYSNIYNATGDLDISSDVTRLKNGNRTENFAAFINNGQAELYYDNVKRFETLSDGVNITGTLKVNGSAISTGGLGNVVEDTTPQLGGDLQSNGNDIDFADNDKAIFGAGSDLQIFHDGNFSRIKDAGTGDLVLQSNTISFVNAADSETLAQFKENGSVDLYFDGSKKLDTTSNGIDINSTGSGNGLLRINGASGSTEGIIIQRGGTEASRISHSNSADLVFSMGSSVATKLKLTSGGNLQIPNDTGKLQLGASQDLQLSHNGSSSVIENSTGYLFIHGNDIALRSPAQENYIVCDANAEVELYYDNSKKFETTSFGATVQGGITFGSDTAAANQLDDYEEGTWTPSLEFGGSSTGITYSSLRGGNYTKIGRQVTVNFAFTLTSKGSATGDAHISGLPFAVADLLSGTSLESNGVSAFWNNVTTNAANIIFGATESTSKINVRFTIGAEDDTDDMQENDFADNTALRGSITYFTAS